MEQINLHHKQDSPLPQVTSEKLPEESSHTAALLISLCPYDWDAECAAAVFRPVPALPPLRVGREESLSPSPAPAATLPGREGSHHRVQRHVSRTFTERSPNQLSSRDKSGSGEAPAAREEARGGRRRLPRTERRPNRRRALASRPWRGVS